MGNNQSNKISILHEGEWDQQGIISLECYWDKLQEIVNKMQTIYQETDDSRYYIQQIKNAKYDKNLSNGEIVDDILKLEKNILQLFETYDKQSYDKFWMEGFKTYYNKRTATITPRITVLWIDSFIDDKYWEATLGAEESSKQSQNINTKMMNLLNSFWPDGEAKETVNYFKIVKVYLLL